MLHGKKNWNVESWMKSSERKCGAQREVGLGWKRTRHHVSETGGHGIVKEVNPSGRSQRGEVWKPRQGRVSGKKGP